MENITGKKKIITVKLANPPRFSLAGKENLLPTTPLPKVTSNINNRASFPLVVNSNNFRLFSPSSSLPVPVVKQGSNVPLSATLSKNGTDSQHGEKFLAPASSKPPTTAPAKAPKTGRKKKDNEADDQKKTWTTEQTYELIQAVKDEVSLYNTKHVDFKNVVKRAKLWNKITDIVNLFREGPPAEKFTSDEISKKWHSLRTQYAGEMKKIRETSGTGADTRAKHKPTMKFFEEMSFVQDYLESRRTVDSSGGEDIVEAILRQEELDDSSIDEGSIDGRSPNADSINEKKKLAGPPLKRRKTSTEESAMTQAFKQAGSFFEARAKIALEKGIQKPKEEDHFDFCGKYVASKLRSMPADRAEEAENIILETLAAKSN